MPYFSETDKVRDRVLKYVGSGRVGDFGCHKHKLLERAIGVDCKGPPATVANVVWDLNTPLPFTSGYFDTIFSSHCLEHLKLHPVEVLSNWWDALKPGGHLILYLPHADLYKERNPEHVWNFRPQLIEDVLRRIGAVIVHTEVDDPRPDFYSFLVVALKPQRG